MDPHQVRNTGISKVTLGEVVKMGTGVLSPVVVNQGTGGRVPVANTDYKFYKISFCKNLVDTFSLPYKIFLEAGEMSQWAIVLYRPGNLSLIQGKHVVRKRKPVLQVILSFPYLCCGIHSLLSPPPLCLTHTHREREYTNKKV